MSPSRPGMNGSKCWHRSQANQRSLVSPFHPVKRERSTQKMILNRTHFWNSILSRKRYCLTLPGIFLDTMTKQRYHTGKLKCTVQLLESPLISHLFFCSTPRVSTLLSFGVCIAEALMLTLFSPIIPIIFPIIIIFCFSYPKGKQPEQLHR